ncbi:MAG: Rieske 2Fe-2S domain-containing protein [Thiotrichales bacterium]|nr:Rieske 2Fe-2S domain-containing protein [Thiotrichales bacterium]
MKTEIDLNTYTNVALDRVLKSLNEASQTPFEKAIPIPSAVNHSIKFYNFEQDKIFNQEWICIGRCDEIPAPGDYLTHEIAGTPVLAVRQESGEIIGFVNACAHRFTCLVKDRSGHAFAFTCPNHAWTYGIDGQLNHAPFMDSKPGFDPKQNNLEALHTESWEGFLYITLSKKPSKSITKSLENFRENIVGQYDMSSYQTVIRESMSWNANWKNLIENFTESYHVPIAHQKTFANHKKQIKDYECGEDSYHYCYHFAPQESDSGSGAAHPNNTKLKGGWRRTMVDFCVFPNHLVTLMPDYLWWVSVMPSGVGQFKATWGVAVPPEILDEIPKKDYDNWLQEMVNYMSNANEEDRSLVEGLFRGSASHRLPRGAFHPIEKNLWQFMRYLSKKTG